MAVADPIPPSPHEYRRITCRQIEMLHFLINPSYSHDNKPSICCRQLSNNYPYGNKILIDMLEILCLMIEYQELLQWKKPLQQQFFMMAVLTVSRHPPEKYGYFPSTRSTSEPRVAKAEHGRTRLARIPSSSQRKVFVAVKCA